MFILTRLSQVVLLLNHGSSFALLHVHVEKLCGRGPRLFGLFALEAVVASANDHQLNVPISLSKRFSHSQALFARYLCVMVAVNKQDRSVYPLSYMDWGVLIAGSAYQRNVEIPDARIARRIPPTLNIGDRKIRDDGFDSTAPGAGE